MGRSQRRKGQVGEREAVSILKKIGCLRAERRVRNYGDDSDLVNAIPGVSFECKLMKAVAIGSAMRQAEEQAREGELPAVLHRETLKRGERGKRPWCITVRLEDMPALLNHYLVELNASR